MKKKRVPFSVLMKENKEEIVRDFRELEKIEKRMDQKYVETLNETVNQEEDHYSK